jgi:hypothetical protein
MIQRTPTARILTIEMTAQSSSASGIKGQIGDKKPNCAVEASDGEAEAGAAGSSRRKTAESLHYDEFPKAFNSGLFQIADDLEVKRQL